jgi:DNA-binding protein H-NS
MSTYRNVKAQIAKLEKQASDLFKKEVDQVVARVRALIAEYGLTAADLGLAAKVGKVVKGLRKKSAAAKKPAGIPMYVDPVSGKTWTGKGKQPTFIVEGLKKGKAKSDFLIAKKAAAPAVVAKPAKAAKKPAAVAKPAKKAAAKPAAKPVAKKAAKKPAAKKVAAKPAAAAKPADAAA